MLLFFVRCAEFPIAITHRVSLILQALSKKLSEFSQLTLLLIREYRHNPRKMEIPKNPRYEASNPVRLYSYTLLEVDFRENMQNNGALLIRCLRQITGNLKCKIRVIEKKFPFSRDAKRLFFFIFLDRDFQGTKQNGRSVVFMRKSLNCKNRKDKNFRVSAWFFANTDSPRIDVCAAGNTRHYDPRPPPSILSRDTLLYRFI